MMGSTPDDRPPGTRIVIKLATRATVVALFLAAALLGTVGGVLFAYGGDLPEISALDNYRPNTITRILAGNGDVIGEFATERRVVIGYDDIAPVLRSAIMATEDADFEQHFGLSISRIAMTAVKDVITGQRAGASTITQQLARNLFLQNAYMRGGVYERSLERKIREAILAVQLERRFTKREIFALYANQVPLHGAYGVEAGARMYFNKSAKDVTLDEAATIAAIIQTPARLSPFVNPERTLARRNNYVLPRMAEEGFITRQAAEEAATETDRAPRPEHDGALVRRLLRRRHPQEPRAALRRGGAVRDRPAGADDARHPSAARRRARRGPRAAPRRQAPRGLSQASPDRACGQCDARDLHHAAAGRGPWPPATSSRQW